jgi:hypothetical protein
VTLGVVLTLSISYFLAYNTVWEYQFTSVLPASAICLLVYQKALRTERVLLGTVLAATVCILLPSLYIVVRHAPLNDAALTTIRLTRTAPVFVMYCALLTYSILLAIRVRREVR